MAGRKYRKHIRLKGYDYSKPGYYFVTVCAKDHKDLFVTAVDPRFGHRVDFDVAARPWRAPLSVAHAQKRTEIVIEKLNLIPEKFSAFVDFYVVVPNHLHFILVLEGAAQGAAATEKEAGQGPAATEKEAGQGPAATKKKAVELPWIISAFKGWCTREFGERLFQPNYYEHVIRNEDALDSIRHYILEHPYREFNSIEWEIIEEI